MQSALGGSMSERHQRIPGMRYRPHFIGFALLSCFLVYILISKSGCSQNYIKLTDSVIANKLPKGPMTERQSLPLFELPDLSVDQYASLYCPSQVKGISISDVYLKLKALESSTVKKCTEASDAFKRIYDMQQIDGTISMPEELASRALKDWMKNDEELFEKMKRQDIYKVSNNYLSEETVFNILRSKRPVAKPNVDPEDYVEMLANKSAKSCDFCSYKTNTAEDEFGRVEGSLSATASNSFKLAKYHGLIFPFKHEPVELPLETLKDMFLNTIPKWCSKVMDQDSDYSYPTILWDTLPHAGASQVHPHVHILMDKGRYSGMPDTFLIGGNRYFEDHNRLLWNDLVLVHTALGLAYRKGSAVAIVSLTAKKDHEFTIISPTLNEDAVELIYYVMRAYQEHLGVYCFSSGGALPILNNPSLGLPFIFRIGSRGDCAAVRSDVSSLELYSIYNINSDIAETMKALKKATPSNDS